jgi:hypothetical protein
MPCVHTPDVFVSYTAFFCGLVQVGGFTARKQTPDSDRTEGYTNAWAGFRLGFEVTPFSRLAFFFAVDFAAAPRLDRIRLPTQADIGWTPLKFPSPVGAAAPPTTRPASLRA